MFTIKFHLIFDTSVNGKLNFSLRTPTALRQGLLDTKSGQMWTTGKENMAVGQTSFCQGS